MSGSSRHTTGSITISLNNLDKLKSTLETLIQSDLDEIIVIDGKSNDGSFEYLNHLSGKDSRLRFISELDNGLYDAMNKGIQLAKSDYLIFVNAGDFLLHKKFNSFQDLYDKNPFLIFGKSADCKNYSDFLKSKITTKPIKPIWLLKVHMITHHQSIIFKNHEKLKYDLKYTIGSDFKLISQIYQTNKKKVLKVDNLLCVNEYAGISSNHSLGLKEHISILQELYNYNSLQLKTITLYLVFRIKIFKLIRGLRQTD